MMAAWLVLSLAGPMVCADDVPTAASWIWYPESVATEGVGQTRYLRRTVTLGGVPREAQIRVRADDSYSFSVNGAPPPKTNESGIAGDVYDLGGVLVEGENVLAFSVHNAAGTGGLIVTGRVVDADGQAHEIRSDTSFRTSREAVEGWDRPGFDDADWPGAGIVGSAYAQPWYRHAAFDMQPFLEEADRERWEAWRAPLLRLPEGIEDEPPTTARFDVVNGSCALLVDGEPRPPFIYRGTVDPLSSHGRRQVGLFRDAGVHVYTMYLPLEPMWKAPGDYDFSQLDDVVRGYLSVDPEARLFVILRLIPPRWWMDRHEDELVRYAAGDDYNTSDESGRVRRASLASKLWQQDALHIWRAAIEHLERHPWGKRVIGYQPGYGIYTEWHYFGSWREQMPDTGPAMTAHFREWLRGRYGTVDDLREAWLDTDVTFETATVPGVQPRLAAGRLDLRDPAAGQWVADYYRCQQEVTADDIELFCAAAKEATGGRAMAGVFYGYFYGVHPQTQGGHLELERLLASPNVDYFAAPYDYSHRLMGDDGRGRAICDAFPLAGKVHMIEADTRTHLHPRNEYGKLATTEESIAAIRREVATALTHGSALWWCDFGADGSGGWYDQPELIGEVKKLVALAEERLNTPRKRVAEVALVCDLGSCYSLNDGAAMRTHLRLLDEVTTELYRTGTPFDTILLSQLPKADLSGYKMLIFLNTLKVDAPTRRFLARATRERSVLWLWAPGITDGKGFGAELVSELTGFQVTLEGRGTPASVVTCEVEHPLTRDLPTVPTWALDVRELQPVAEALDAGNWYNPRDEKTMEQQYSRFDWEVRGDALRWNFATAASWTDIHLAAEIPECDGVSLTLAGEGIGAGLGVRLVVKGGDGGEFVAPSFGLTAEPLTQVLPFPSFAKASWDRTDSTEITFPLRGLKVVLDGTGGGREGTLILRGLAGARGTLSEGETRSYGSPAHPAPVLTVDDEKATALGRDATTGKVLLACRGKAPRRHVLSTVPYVPRELLVALMEEAGVCRTIDSPDVIVRADSNLVSLHTAVGGTHELRLPRSASVRDALTGEVLGRGRRVSLDLPASSTTLLTLEAD